MNLEFTIQKVLYRSVGYNGYTFCILKGFRPGKGDEIHTICGEVKEPKVDIHDSVLLKDARLEYNSKFSSHDYKTDYLMKVNYPIDEKHALIRMKSMKIKPSFAKIILRHNTDDPWKCIRENKKPNDIPTIQWLEILEKVNTFKRGSLKKEETCESKIDFLSWLETKGLSWGDKVAESIVVYFQHIACDKIVSNIENDLLCLRDVNGIGLVKLKQLVNVLDLTDEQKYRFNVVLYILDKQSITGNVYFKAGDIPYVKKPSELTDILYVHPETSKICLKEQRDKEIHIATMFNKLNGEQLPLNPKHPESTGIIDIMNRLELSIKELNEEQNEAYTNAVSYGISCITGVPGAGKSYVIGKIIQNWQSIEELQSLHICLLAPTGKAVYRLKEMCSQLDVNMVNISCMTIHKLVYGSQQLIDAPNIFLVVDECSMVDTPTFDLLVTFAEKFGVDKIVLVGDPDQLPPVGYGDVFRNILESNRFKTATLKTVYRQSAGKTALNLAIQSVKQHNVPQIIPNDPSYERLCVQINMEQVFLKVVNRYTHLEFEKQDVLILASTNKTVNAYQLKLANVINPNRNKNSDSKTFVLGDVVRHQKNIYNGDTVLLNGTPGVVTTYNQEFYQVNFNDGQCKTYETKKSEESLELGYIGTVHKSQGSESRVVILILETYTSLVHNWNLLYTAITRAKEKCIVIGPNHVYAHMISTDTPKRCTSLCEHFHS